MPGPDETAALRDNLIHRVNLGDLLARTAARAPEAEAIVDSGRRITWRAFDEDVNRLATALIADGWRIGDRLALMAANSAEFLIVYYACAKAGLVCVPINLGWRGGEVAYVLQHSGARALVVDADLAAVAADALGEAPAVAEVVVIGTGAAPVAGRPARTLSGLMATGGPVAPQLIVDDRAPLHILYTSGTTSSPKGVVGSHLAVYMESLTIAIEWRFSDSDRIACMMPMFHTGQLNLFCTPAVAVGACMVVMPAFDAERLLGAIEDEGASVIFGLPMMYRALIEHPGVERREVGTLRLAVYGMAPMPDADLRRAMELLGCDFSLMFGQTEMNSVTTIFRPEDQLTHGGSVGTPTVNTHVAIMDDDGHLLQTGETGEIVYRGPQTMTGYYHDPEATRRAFAHGWFHSGDVGRFDADGILWFEDRTKDVIKTGGENVASIEVEKAVYAASDAVQEAAVVGLPHARWGEAITVVVVPKPGATLEPEDVRAGLRARLDGFKLPKDVIVVDELPKTATGKIQKHTLRADHADHYRR